MWYDSYMTHNIENTKNDSQRIILESDKILKLSLQHSRDITIRIHSVEKIFQKYDVKRLKSIPTYFNSQTLKRAPPRNLAQVDSDFSIFMGYLISSFIWPSPLKFLTNLTNHRIYLKHSPMWYDSFEILTNKKLVESLRHYFKNLIGQSAHRNDRCSLYSA